MGGPIWPLPIVDRGGLDLSPASSALTDLALISLFGLQHSVMARPWFKTRFMRRIPPAFERCTYVHAANVALFALILLWQPIAVEVWSFRSPLREAIWVAGARRMADPAARRTLVWHSGSARHRADARLVPRRAAAASAPQNRAPTNLAESIVLQAYVQLPLLPPQADGSRVAPLKSFAHCDLRLVEEVAGASDQPVLRVELFDRRARSAVKVRVARGGRRRFRAFLAMIPLAKSYET